jgi:tetratricopeptide (TPR) repeat protein
MIDGRLAPFGTHYVLSVTATDCRTGETLATTQAEATSSEAVLTELGTVASEMRTRLGESLPSLARFDTPIAKATTPSLPALKAYALALEERRRSREVESIAFLKQAIELDPTFAQAHATLSTVYGVLGELELSERHAREAYTRQDRVSEHERLFIRYQYHDRVTGNQEAVVETLQAWQAAYPRDFVPANALSVVYNRLGQYDKALAAGMEALRRSPDHPFAISNVAVAHRGRGNYDQAIAIAKQGVRVGAATMPTRRLLYQLGVLTGDPAAAEQLAWSRGQPREFDLVAAQGQIAMFEGRWGDGESLYRRAIELALARGFRGNAAGQAAHLAWLEAIYRPGPDLDARVRRMLAFAAGGDDEPTSARFRGAAAMGLAGRRAAALAIVKDAEARSPESTYVTTVLAPVTRAAVALHAGRPAEAVAALEAARPTETGGLGALVPIYLRAEAFRSQGAWSEAADEYEKLIRHRGTDPYAPMVPLAWLGLGRVRVAGGNMTVGRTSYEMALSLWRAADTDFPPRRVAQAEYDRLAPGQPSGVRGAQELTSRRAP